MNVKRMLASLATAVAGLLTGSVAYAQGSGDGYGFLNLPTSAHVYALGGNNLCVIDQDVSLADQNPALIGPELGKQIMANYMLYRQSGNFAGVRYGMGVGEHSAWAIGMRYLNYGKFEGYDEFGTPTGSFTPSDLIIESTYSRDITERWRGGVNLKMAYSSYEHYNAFALAADLGVNYYDPEHDLSFSVVLRNMGGQIKRFGNRYARVPFDIQIGYMQSLGNSPIQLSITANNLVRWRIPYYDYNKESQEQIKENMKFFPTLFRHLIFGLQYQANDKFYVALAYNYKTASDMTSFNRSFLSGFSLGTGFRVKGFSADIAYGLPHRSGSTLMLNIGYTISSLLSEE